VSDYVKPIPKNGTVPVANGGLFPVRRVYGIRRNYAAHSIEMGDNPDCDPPVFSQKNQFIWMPQVNSRPENSSDVHYEVEMTVADNGHPN
jgi:fumarylpyruvate hydrolase